MNNIETIPIGEYLTRKGIPFREVNGELITRCLFNGCDDDSTGSEAHLYFNAKTSQYHCKKCGATGNIITLAKHLGESVGDVSTQKLLSEGEKDKISKQVENCHNRLPPNIREYLHNRGITDDLITDYKLGWGKFYRKDWITIPLTDKTGKYIGMKLRKNPDDLENEAKYKVFPAGTEATIYGWEVLKNNPEMVVICEGEFDRLVLTSYGIPAITSSAGAGTFKAKWLEELKGIKTINICYDRDEAGQRGAEKLANYLSDKLRDASICKIILPDRMTEGKDITDYFVKYDGNPDELLMYAKPINSRIAVDVSQFSPMGGDDIAAVLDQTIKGDKASKVAAFLGMESAFTENAQFNVAFNAPSSAGKSHIATEIIKLFPKESVMKLGQASPQSFFHDNTDFDEDTQEYILDLSRKIILFIDQQNMILLERLRPLLSHDMKEYLVKITDRTQKSGLRTKTIRVIGYPAVVFCTAKLDMDEQESTRLLLLSPEITDPKIRDGIIQTIDKEADNEEFEARLDQNSARTSLRLRIQAIKDARINEIKIPGKEKIKERFLSQHKNLKPRLQRDIKRLLSLVKCFALLNLWWRQRDGDNIVANEDDIDEAFKLWDVISASQELGLSPIVHQFYLDVIAPMLKVDSKGLDRQEIMNKYFAVNRRTIDSKTLTRQMLPMLESVGLIYQERSEFDKRKILVYPPAGTPISTEDEAEINRDTEAGVEPQNNPNSQENPF